MGKTATNLSVALGLIAVVFGIWYIYNQYTASQAVEFDASEQTMQNMLNNTRVFIQHRQTLQKVSLDISIFEDDRFNSLESFSTPIEERPIGRPDPFADVNVRN